MKTHLLLAALMLGCLASSARAQISQRDFLLHFDGDLNSTTGEGPVAARNLAFERGIANQGVYLPEGSYLDYNSGRKINATQGTIEFWVKPRWNSDDNLHHGFFSLGDTLLVFKDSRNYLSCFFKYAENQWISVRYLPAQHWEPRQWHHVAVTWGLPGRVILYVDGYVVRYLNTKIESLVAPFPDTFSIGRWDEHQRADAILDEFRVSQRALSGKEIAESLAGPLQVRSLTPQTNSIEMFRDWNINTNLFAETQIGTVKLPLAAASATSRDEDVVTINEDGRLQAVAPGTTWVTAIINGVRAGFTVQVRTPAREPELDVLPTFLQEPAPGSLFTIPVVIIKYLPTRDGVYVDNTVANYTGTLAKLNDRLLYDAIRTKFSLEEGSRFHGYKEPSAAPSLGYQVIASLTIYEDTPPGFPTNTPDVYFTDYNLILNRIGARSYVMRQGVKEFWLWTYHHGNIAPAESNMSSPTTGDISNSYRYEDDMPIYDRTYTLYNYNFTRTSNEDVHNHGHQLEALLGYANLLQDGNTDLFWRKFVGRDENYFPITGRCGWTHMPPNTTTNYDYGNLSLVSSDIETWTPEGLGSRQLVNAATWRDKPYAWPLSSRPEDVTQIHWYIYWMQNMPGRDNHIPYLNTTMTNWWAFTGDWEGSIRSGLGLYASPSVGRRIEALKEPAQHRTRHLYDEGEPNPWNVRKFL